jgi:drug/metabolite transporter (DMT)-like permease
MLMLCLSWGFNQIAVKLALPDVPPMLQALIRSAGALPVMLFAGWLRGVKFFERDGSLVPGLMAGTLFGIEFVLIFTGLVFTSASRAAVFLYTAPFFVALGSYQFLGERLSMLQWGGLGSALPASRSRSACRSRTSMPRFCSATCWLSPAARCGQRPR